MLYILPALLVTLAIYCVFVARWMAYQRNRSRVFWMSLTAILGPIPLIVLALLPLRK